MLPRIYDVNGRERHMEWLCNKYGNVRFLDGGEGRKFALVRVDETEGTALIKVGVLDEEGLPQVDQPVANHWPDENLPDLRGGGLETLWHDHACVQRTDANGITGYGLGGGSFISDLGVGGPHTIWVISPSLPSDGLAGVGMLGNTNHMGPLFLTFQIVDETPQPPPEPSMEAVLEKLEGIHADLHQLMRHLGAN